MACTTITADQLRPKLLAMAQDPNPYPLLSVVEDYLSAVPQDDQLRASAIRSLVNKGLLSVAVEVAQECPAASPNAGELHAAADQLARTASDRIDWSTTDQRFAANLTALGSRGPAAEALARGLEQAWQQIEGKFTLHQANDGNVQVRTARSDGRRTWIPAALDYHGEVEALPDADSWQNTMLAPFLFDGVGIGALVPRVRDASRCTFLNYSPAIFIVESNVRALALALRLHDWSAALADERVYLFTGESAWNDWRDLMCRDCSLPAPSHVFRLTRWPGQPPSPAGQMLAEVRQQRESLQARCRERAGQVYADRDRAFWAQRYRSAGPQDPLRVLLLTSRFTTFLQHSTLDAMAAFERMGARTRLLIEDRDHLLIPPHRYLDTVADFQPDLILVIDHHRHEYPGRFVDNLPFVCWIQDELPAMFNGDVGRRLGPLDFTMGFGLTRCVLQHGYPAERFMPCRLAINPAKFAPPIGAAGPDPGLHCDLAYVSHHSEPPEALHARVRKLAGNEHLVRIMDAFFEETRPLMTASRFNGAWDLEALLCLAEQRVGMRCEYSAVRERLMSMYVRPLVDRTIRHTTLTWAADWADANRRTLHLYGNGWEQHPRFARYARGPAQHGPHLGEIIRNAAINLHAGLNSALHQRVLETLCAGGFLMVRYHPHDFCPESHHSLLQYLEERGIDQPVKIPLDQVPPECAETMRQRAAATGRSMSETFDITEEWLLTARGRRRRDERYDFANLAFPDFAQITFDSAETFARRADEFIANPEQRHALARRMQEAVNELFTYDSLVRKLIAFITDFLGTATSSRCAGMPPISQGFTGPPELPPSTLMGR